MKLRHVLIHIKVRIFYLLQEKVWFYQQLEANENLAIIINLITH
jgi:hypothetical protein